ncbi:MAG TPA: winged helix DNA-binding protein [Allosphingosinicella sp.]|jgi:DNA-binding MarR family transcriptional regulator|nr:winged helix DNA-binding protein [Allosphingosinicella sp.]
MRPAAAAGERRLALTEPLCPDAEPAGPESRQADLAAFARSLYKNRRRRDELMPAKLFGEPAWDILLDLFAQDCAGRETSVISACIAAAAPQTTALRYIGRLAASGLVRRLPVPSDRRRTLLRLTPKGRAAVTLVLKELSAACIDGGRSRNRSPG